MLQLLLIPSLFFNLIFWLSIVGILYNRNNLFLVLLTIEISFLVLIILYALSSTKLSSTAEKQAYCLLLLILAAAESATGLAIIINNYNSYNKPTFSNNEIMQG